VRAIVLVKQVPDLRAAPVGVLPDGTIAREAAAAITNPADLHALEAALQLADEVVALTMGPPRAEDVLRDAISRGATGGALLCDRALAGSDTWATANALAAAIDHLGGADLVVSGLTALDGETGQVGPQVACRLGLPQATAVEAIERDGDALVARRIVEGGYERLRLPLPALVTVAETGYTPRYPTLPGRRRAAQAELVHLTAAELGLTGDRVGLEASPTKVAHMAPAPLPDRGCRLVGEDFTLDDLVAELVELGALTAADRPAAGDGTSPTASDPEPGEPETDCPAVWVVCETDEDELSHVSAELLTKARELAPGLGGGVGAFVAHAAPDRAVADAARFGADVVYRAAHPELAPYRCQPHARVLHDAVRAHGPAALLFGATTTGRDLAPRVASLLDAGLAADCTDLDVGPWDRRHVHYEALLHQIRPAMAGGVLATCVAPVVRPQMATVRPGVFVPRPSPRRAAVVDLPVTLADEDLAVRVLDRQIRRGDVRLADAEVIVAGGAGCDAQSWHLVEELAGAIGGSVAATRAAVEAGLAPRSLQVGQTGATVHPRLYVACGVSGALQHVVGMRAARTIVAVNRDPDAFMFRTANFGIVGEVTEVLPALSDALRRAATSGSTTGSVSR
jgi:electron transfer flavoprotein alpha subunit